MYELEAMVQMFILLSQDRGLGLRWQRVPVGGLLRIWNPSATLTGDRFSREAEHIAEPEELERLCVCTIRQGQEGPVVLDIQGKEATFSELLLVVGGQRRGSHDVDLLEAAPVQRFRCCNGGTGLAGTETMVDQETAIGGHTRHVVTHELLIVEGLQLRGAFFTGILVEDFGFPCESIALVLHDACQRGRIGKKCLNHEAAERGSSYGTIDFVGGSDPDGIFVHFGLDGCELTLEEGLSFEDGSCRERDGC